MHSPRFPIAALAWGLVACAPALDWREFVPEGSGLGVSFPCQPDHHERVVTLAGARLPMHMLVCSADATTFAISFVDVVDPAAVASVLSALQALAVGNLQGSASPPAPWQVKGMTPNPASVRLSVDGRLPDGAAVQAHAAFFVRGLRVYQATVIGARPAPPVVDTFMSALKFPA